MIDVRRTWQEPLTEEKLFSWHGMLLKDSKGRFPQRVKHTQDAVQQHLITSNFLTFNFKLSTSKAEPKIDGTMGAVEGAKDDLVISTAGGVWLATSYMSLPKMIRSGTGKRLRQRKTEAVI